MYHKNLLGDSISIKVSMDIIDLTLGHSDINCIIKLIFRQKLTNTLLLVVLTRC